jgi:tetratricopeptide (TPR) repeat protein
MAIRFPCPHCKRALSVKDQLAGKKATCPACKKALIIPGQAPAPAKGDSATRPILSELLEAPAQTPQTIDFTCPQCDEPVSLSSELGGKQAPCPQCRRIIKVPLSKTMSPGDWRKTDHLPTGARRDAEPTPEGAWGTSGSTSLVSREALVEAEVIPSRRRPVLTRKQKVLRFGLAGGALVVLGLVAWLGFHFWQKNQQEALVTRALKMAETGTIHASGAVAEIHRAAGEYYFRTDQRGCATRAQALLNKARDLATRNDNLLERDLQLTDLALLQLDLGGVPPEVQQEKRLEWKKVLNSVRQTLTDLKSSGGRLNAVRRVVQKMVGQGMGNEAARLAQVLAVSEERRPGGSGDEEVLANEAPEVLAVAGLELFRAGQNKEAEELLTQALKYYPAEVGPRASPPPPLASSVVALSMALGKPAPPPGKSEVEATAHTIGRAQGLALQGNQAGARASLAQTKGDIRLAGLIALGGTPAEAGPPDLTDLEQAATLLENELRGRSLSSWGVYRLVELMAQAGQIDRAQKITEFIPNPTLRCRAQVNVLHKLLSNRPDPADDQLVEGVEKQTLALGLAREALMRHNSRIQSSAVGAVEGWEERWQPFGLAGAALGMQDRDRR